MQAGYSAFTIHTWYLLLSLTANQNNTIINQEQKEKKIKQPRKKEKKIETNPCTLSTQSS